MPSESQPQPTTGTSSIDSLQAVLSEEAVRQAMEAKEGILRLGLMSSIQSIHRNLKTEDDANKQDIGIHQRELWGSENVNTTAAKEDEMEVMAARDVIVNPPQQSQPPQQQNGMTPVQSALMAASIALGAGGIGYTVANNQDPAPPAATIDDTDTRTQITVGFGDPKPN